MPWPTTLHKLVSEESSDAWTAVLSRVATHPHEVGVQGAGYGQTVLHVACYRYPPASAVGAFLEACPDAAVLQNSDGETALHLAMDGASEEVQLLLLRARPGAVAAKDRYGDTPLHLACSSNGVSTDLLRVMVEAAPEAASQLNGRGETPLHLLSKTCESAAAGADGDDDRDEEERADDWARAELLLRAAYRGAGGGGGGIAGAAAAAVPPAAAASLDSAALASMKGAASDAASTWVARQHQQQRERGQAPPSIQVQPRREEEVPVLHAAAGCRCPRTLLRTAARMFPEQALVRDALGRTPLAVAALAEVWSEPRTDDDDEVAAGSGDNDAEDNDDEGGANGNAGNGGGAASNREGARARARRAASFVLPPGQPLAPSDLHPDNLPLRGRLDLDAIIHLHSSDEEREDDDGPPLAPGISRPSRSSKRPGKTGAGSGGALNAQGRQRRRRKPCVIDLLVHLDPRAASVPDLDGRLPLHLAVEAGKAWDDGLRSLIWAAPRALETRDVETRLYPFMIAATVKDRDAAGSGGTATGASSARSRAPMLGGGGGGLGLGLLGAGGAFGSAGGLGIRLPSLGGFGGGAGSSVGGSSANSTAVVTTVYELLRTLPELVSMGIPAGGYQPPKGGTELAGQQQQQIELIDEGDRKPRARPRPGQLPAPGQFEGLLGKRDDDLQAAMMMGLFDVMPKRPRFE